MAYKCEFGNGQEVYIENQGVQTVVTLASGSPGQQQQASTGFQTGKWTLPPTLFRTATGVILRIESEQGQSFVQLQAGGISTMSGTPALGNAEVLSLQQVEIRQSQGMPPMEPMKPMEPMRPMEPMKPMEPMEPMKMGDMEMNMNPMQMRMGNMSMQMGSSSFATSGKRFCSQCGAAVTPSDRFCSNCGYQL
ncbi:MAG: zinc-ribbon domain-containing protein [Okeania sp. SIO2F4]|uniref:zinc-ribbon domain-containing protein n=1 Tax=Okeania sp. SIO2F4 TaxID=2607790 RepID=UPI00142B22E5|nr:zinc-ribbon domain-containing protein [Okeania sp. SIO2F4]NES03702.1 zinc-ribbon domain-containing protein [Okeania sp. SIO2F4]